MQGTYAFRTILDSGGVLAFGSDSPFGSADPLLGVYGAVTRRTSDERHPNGWLPGQKISVGEAVRAFTWGSAYAEFQEDWKGTIEPGKLADFVILSENIFAIDPVEIRNVKVLSTFLNGVRIYQARPGLGERRLLMPRVQDAIKATSHRICGPDR